MQRSATRLVAVLLALGVWQLLTSEKVDFWLAFDKLPGPLTVFSVLANQLTTATYYEDVGASLGRIGIGFALAGIVGSLLGIALARSVVANDTLGTLVEIARPIPAIALVPIALLVLPTNEQGIVAITFVAALFPVVISTEHAVRALPISWEDAVRTMGGNRFQVLVHVVLPGALPGIIGGLSVGLGVAWVCLISAEMISGQYGIGYRTWLAYTLVNYPAVIAGMITIGALGWGSSTIVRRLGRRATAWLPREEEP